MKSFFSYPFGNRKEALYHSEYVCNYLVKKPYVPFFLLDGERSAQRCDQLLLGIFLLHVQLEGNTKSKLGRT
jgi:hypothetical protein